MFHQTLDVGQAGDQVGALIKGLKRDEVKRGMLIAKPGTVKLVNRAMAQVCAVHLISSRDEATLKEGVSFGRSVFWSVLDA